MKDREKGDATEIEERPYFRVTVALPSVSRHRLCATRCILPLLSNVCVCARCIGCIYIWPEGGASLVLMLACLFLYVRMCVLHACIHAYAFVHVQRGSVVPAVLLFGTARRVNPGQCVVKKPYVRRGCHTSVRATKREETRREKREEARGMACGQGRGKRATQMCTVRHIRTYACMHARTHVRSAFAMRTTVEPACPLPNQAAPARRASLALEHERVLRAM